MRPQRLPLRPRRSLQSRSTSPRAEALDELARDVVEIRGVLEHGYDEWRRFRIEIAIQRGWHLAGHSAGLAGVKVSAVLGTLRNVKYPPGETWSGKLVIEGEVAPPEVGAPSLELRYQPCDDSRCLPSVERLVRLQ